MLSGDLCKRSTPGVELDQRAREIRLGLERVERLLVQRPDRCFRLGENFVVAERSAAFSHTNSSRWDRCDNQVRTPRVVVIGVPHLPVPNNGGDR